MVVVGIFKFGCSGVTWTELTSPAQEEVVCFPLWLKSFWRIIDTGAG